MEGLRTRRAFLAGTMTAAAAVALASCAAAPAAKRIPRVGWMEGPASSQAVNERLEAFRAGLRDLGHVEGRTIQIEQRNCVCEGRGGEWGEIAAELVALPVDVIVTPETLRAVDAAVRATKVVPIVSSIVRDPISYGVAASLARPGGNVTGIWHSAEVESRKRLELLRELVPPVKHVGAVFYPVAYESALSAQGARDAARELGIGIMDVLIDERSGERSELATRLPKILERAVAEGADAFLIGAVPAWILDLRHEISAYALQRGIPLVAAAGVTADEDWAESGALAAFGAEPRAISRRLAYFVDRILKGASAGDLPIEQPSQFETVINLKTAKALGLTIPQSVLSRATKVIQ